MSPKTNPNPKLTTNTHYYDGKLPSINIQTPNKSLAKTIQEIKLKFPDPRVHRCLELFSHKDNYDPLNKLDAGVLLRAVWAQLPPELVECFGSILIEIIEMGPCVQGRTIRLYQLYTSIQT